MAAGTAAALVPIRSITCKSRNETITYLEDNSLVPLFQELYNNLTGIQKGKVADPFGWCHVVGPAEGYVRTDTEKANKASQTLMSRSIALLNYLLSGWRRSTLDMEK
jgi:hypothetical protein